MQKHYYPAIFHQEENGYFVEFPDIQGCYTEGNSLEHAIDMAKEILGIRIEMLEEQNEALPSPSNPLNLKLDDKGFISIIELDYLAYKRRYNKKSVKKNLTIPEWLNTMAEQANINFSNVLQQALKQKLGIM